eukprot:42481-Hanusia_phi.AAC.1
MKQSKEAYNRHAAMIMMMVKYIIRILLEYFFQFFISIGFPSSSSLGGLSTLSGLGRRQLPSPCTARADQAEERNQERQSPHGDHERKRVRHMPHRLFLPHPNVTCDWVTAGLEVIKSSSPTVP